MSERTVPLTVGDHTFQVRRKHSWQTYKPWLELNEKRAALHAATSENSQEQRAILLPFADLEDEYGNLAMADVPEEILAELEVALAKINPMRAEVAANNVKALDLMVEQATINLGDQADAFFEAIDDYDYDDAYALIEKVASGSIDEDLSPVDAAEAADLPLDGSSPSSPPPVVTPPPVPTGEADSSPSDSTPAP